MTRRGFTLLEVMVALAILAASLVAISEVAGGALRNHVRARHRVLAHYSLDQVSERIWGQYRKLAGRDE